MKKTKLIAVSAFLSITAFMGCSHTPHTTQGSSTAEVLSARLKNTLVQELESRRDLKKIKEVEVYQVEPDKGDSYRISYRASFDSDGQPFGEVSHAFDGTAVIVKTSNGEWKVERLERNSQSLDFHQPATSVIERKKTSQNE